MIKEKYAVVIAKVLLAILIGVVSYFILASKVPQLNYVQETLDHLEEDKATAIKFSGATVGTSFAISFLPDDIGTPVANTLADMNNFLIAILAVVFVERLIVVEGIKIAFLYLIPVSCAIYAVATLLSNNFLRAFSTKLFILAAAVVCVIPFATHFARDLGSDYLAYVNETIDETSAQINQIASANSEESQAQGTIEKISDTWKNATEGVSDAVDFIKSGIMKFGNAIAVLVVTTFILPLLILFFFRWLLNELFRFELRLPQKKTEVAP